MTLDKPLPVRLREMWLSGTQNGMSREEFSVIQSRELDQLAAIWTRALQLPGRFRRWHLARDRPLARYQ